MTPTPATLDELRDDPRRWPLALSEEWSERAGIVEADEGCSRAESERRAAEIVRRRVERERSVVYPAHQAREVRSGGAIPGR